MSDPASQDTGIRQGASRRGLRRGAVGRGGARPAGRAAPCRCRRATAGARRGADDGLRRQARAARPELRDPPRRGLRHRRRQRLRQEHPAAPSDRAAAAGQGPRAARRARPLRQRRVDAGGAAARLRRHVPGRRAVELDDRRRERRCCRCSCSARWTPRRARPRPASSWRWSGWPAASTPNPHR
ncbi:MAG: hypothetical protein MZW92_26450 [Comamonadaceae bacterium]|nr:hypothetical protein [Comamonadaceae bacterium]